MEYKYCIIIGRFQPLHRGHLNIIKQALDIADNVIICVGSSGNEATFKNQFSPQKYSSRNPFSFKERKEMIVFSLKELFGDDFRWKDRDIGIISRIKIIPIVDYCNDEIGCSAWMYHVMTQISQVYPNDVFKKGNSCYIGHYKDNTSEYLDWFKFITFIPCKQDDDVGLIHATDIRKAMLNNNLDSVKHYISDYVYRKLMVYRTFKYVENIITEKYNDNHKTIVIFGDNLLLAKNKLPRFNDLDLPEHLINNKQTVMLGDEFVNIIVANNYDFNAKFLPDVLLDSKFQLSSIRSVLISDTEDSSLIQHYFLLKINNKL